MTIPADRDRAALAERLKGLAKLLTEKRPPRGDEDESATPYAYRVPNDHGHDFERTGWLLIRAGAAYIADGDRACALASDWSTRGFPAATGNEPVNGGTAELTSVEAAAMESDQWERETTQHKLERRLLDDNARSAESRTFKIVHVRPNEGRRSSLLECANPKCDHTITGIGSDKPREGRCPRCSTHRYRFPGFEWPHKPAEGVA